MRKLYFGLCENKGPDQLCSDCTADQHLSFATWIVQFLFFLNSEFQVSSVTVQITFVSTWSENRKTGFLVSQLKSLHINLGLKYFTFNVTVKLSVIKVLMMLLDILVVLSLGNLYTLYILQYIPDTLIVLVVLIMMT